MPEAKVVKAEIYEPDEKLPRDLVALRKFAILLDGAIQVPGLRRRVGLDPIIGLIPGVGDAVGAFLGMWIVLGAFRHRVPAPKIARMVVNILADLLVGTIPVVGDIVDFLFPENLQNVDLLIRYRDRIRSPRSLGSIVAGFGFLMVLMALAGLFSIALAIWLIYLLLRDIPLL